MAEEECEMALLETCPACMDDKDAICQHGSTTAASLAEIGTWNPLRKFTAQIMPPTEAKEPHHKSKEHVEEDDPISQAIGEFGPWQLKLTFLLSLFNFPCTWHIFAITFQNMPSDFWCARPDSLSDMPVQDWQNMSHTTTTGQDNTTTYNACRIWDEDYSNGTWTPHNSSSPTRACTAWEFDTSLYGDTLTSEWDLVCDKAQMSNVAEMMFLSGVAIGGLISGVISDRFGRKRTLMCSQMIQTSIALAIAFNPWYELYLVLRCCLGFISVSVVFSGFVLCMELVGGKWRTISGVSYLFPVPLAYITIAGIAYFVRGWQNLQLAITLPSFLLFGMWWILPESPRWLLALGRKEEVKIILQEAARVNKRTLPSSMDKFLHMDVVRDENEPKAGVLDLFRAPQMRKNSLILYVIWFSLYLVYYGLVLNLGNIGGDVYINTVLSGLVEIPAIAISILFLLNRGRRWPMCLTLCGAGVACLLTLAVPIHRANTDLHWVTITFAMIGKFSVSSSNAILPIFTAELFPTVIRNLGVGASNVSAGIALMLVPYLWNLTVMDDRVPMGVLGLFGVVGGLSTLLLPETADRPLIGTLEETEEQPRAVQQLAEAPRKKSSTVCNVSINESLPG